MSERPRRQVRDVDSARQAMRIHAGAWSLIAAVPFGLVGAYAAAGSPAQIPIAIGSALAGVLVVTLGSLLIGSSVGGAISTLYFSRGSSTAGGPGHSRAESLIARGRFDEAVAELETAIATRPRDIAAALRLARLLRDECRRPADAEKWFRIAFERSEPDSAAAIAALREIVEIHTHRLDQPERALPFLARLAAAEPSSPAGDWARREMAVIKARMREQQP